jgi:hypothetical protein
MPMSLSEVRQMSEMIDSSAGRRDERETRHAQFAMRLSLIFGVAMLLGKSTAYFLTHSAAVFSDAAEALPVLAFA